MKSKLLAIIILFLFVVPYSFPMVNAAVTTIPSRYARTVPANTIYFDDFQQGSNQWLKTIVGTSTNTVVTQNSTISFDGNSSLGVFNPNANTQVIAGKMITIQSDIIGIQVWMAFNTIMYTTAVGQAPEVNLQYYSADHNIHNFEVEYRPGLGQWVLFGNTSPGGGSNPQILWTFPGTNGAKNGIKPYNDASWNSWYWMKMVVNTITDRYVSICVAAGCLVNATNYFASVPGASAAGPDPNSFWFRLKITNDASAIASNALFSDFLVTDETPGGPPIIQFGVTLFSAWFPTLVASIAMLYTTSGIGLIRRVWFNKTEGILSSYKTIVATGLIATIGFIVILAIGALLTQQVCSNLPQGTATCSF